MNKAIISVMKEIVIREVPHLQKQLSSYFSMQSTVPLNWMYWQKDHQVYRGLKDSSSCDYGTAFQTMDHIRNNDQVYQRRKRKGKTI